MVPQPAILDVFRNANWSDAALAQKGYVDETGAPTMEAIRALVDNGWTESMLRKHGLVANESQDQSMEVAQLDARPDEQVEQFVALRDKKTEIEREAKEEKKKLDEQMDTIAQRLGQVLSDQGSESQRTPAGTFFWAEKDYVSTPEHNEFLKFVLKGIFNKLAAKGLTAPGTTMDQLLEAGQEADTLDFLTKAVAKEPVKHYVKEHGTPPPGLKYEKQYEVSVRRSSK
jgi:hypothetical protein